MIQPQTTIKIFDNSGVKAIKCVHVEKKAYRHCALVRNIVLGVVTQTKKKVPQNLLTKKVTWCVYSSFLQKKRHNVGQVVSFLRILKIIWV